ncbi:MAG: hypothetical protein JXR61_00075 [Prolixibacteraceae bacterium]|nr:hypothetical protein [Prolixibacteraceae bacterium]
MSRYLFCFAYLVLLFIFYPARSQNHSEKNARHVYDQQYGLDLSLFQGKQYYPESNIVEGHPFWGSGETLNGTVIIDGNCFTEQLLQYDLYHQNFILMIKKKSGALVQIILDAERIDTVLLEDAVFFKNNFPSIGNRFIQQVAEGKNLSCYISWKKQKVIKSTTSTSGYTFTKAERMTFLTYQSNQRVFSRTHQFCKIFPKEYTKAIKQYLSENDIQIRKASLLQLQQLTHFVDQLLAES